MVCRALAVKLKHPPDLVDDLAEIVGIRLPPAPSFWFIELELGLMIYISTKFLEDFDVAGPQATLW